MFCFGMLFTSTVLAQSVADKYMMLKLNGTEDVSVSLDKAPQYWLKGDYLFLKTPDEVRQFEVGTVREIVFHDSSHAYSPILTQESVAVFPTLTTHYLYVKGINDANISIVASNGQQMPVRIQQGERTMQIDVADYPMGVYYVLCGGKSYKFIKGKIVN